MTLRALIASHGGSAATLVAAGHICQVTNLVAAPPLFPLPSNAVACLPHGLPSAFYHTTRVCLLESIFPIKQACRYSGSWLAASYSGANAARRRPWLRKPPTASTRPPRSMSDTACLAVYPQLPLSPQLTPFLSACVPFIEFMCCRCAVISCVGPAEQSRVRKSVETFFSRPCALYCC